MTVPAQPKVYHIVHVDRLPSIISDGYLWCDAEIQRRQRLGTEIGMNGIKRRRLNELTLGCHPCLHVGDCVPFYFCPRSVMLYVIYQGNKPDLIYRGGQTPIVHLVADLHETVRWAEGNGQRWAFTLSNAGAYYFEDRCDLAHLDEVDWEAVRSDTWRDPITQEGKQAEFLLEHCFPWHLVESIGVYSQLTYRNAVNALNACSHRPHIEIKREWYYP